MKKGLIFALLLACMGALAENSGWLYVEVGVSDKGVGSGYVTNANWRLSASRPKGTSNLELSGMSGEFYGSEPAPMDFTIVTNTAGEAYKVTKFGQFSHYGSGANPTLMAYKNMLSEFVAPDCKNIYYEGCFCDCKALTNVVLAEGATISNNRTFQGCGALKSFSPRKFSALGSMQFLSCASLPGSFSITNTTTIGSQLFSGCAKLEEVIAPKVTTVKESAFSGCASLTNVVLSSAATSMEQYAFSGCAKLTTDVVQRLLCKSLTQLWKLNGTTRTGSVFSGCTGIDGTLVWNLPNLAADVVASGMFSGCGNLKGVIFKTPVSSIGGDAFSGIGEAAEIYLAAEVASFGRKAILRQSAPFPKVYLKDNIDAWLTNMAADAQHDVIRAADFNNTSWTGAKPWSTITGKMAQDTAMCKKAGGVVTVYDKKVLAFLMWDNAKGGCWILRAPVKGTTLYLR